MSAGGGAQGRVTVIFRGLPIPIVQAASAHQEALQREFDVLRVDDDHSAVPHRLFALISEIEQEYGGSIRAPRDELRQAVERGLESVDLSYQVPPEVSEAFARLDTQLDEVDEYCRRGEHLITLAAPPEVVRYRKWFLGEFIAQIGGAAPTSWPEYAGLEHAGQGVTSDPGPARPEDDRDADAPATSQPYHLPSGWRVEDRDDEVVVHPSGELDLQSAPQVRDVVLAVRREHTSKVQLDLSAVEFLDSVGLSMIVSAHQRLVSDGVALVVVVPPMLQRLFEISGLGELLDLRT